MLNCLPFVTVAARAAWRAVAAMALAVVLPLAALQGLAVAQDKPAAKAAVVKPGDEPHRREDIAKHRQMARAHEDAARCLESGEKETVCAERLRAACTGIAVGRYCGMRHAH